MNSDQSPLLTDLYMLNMMQTYLENGMTETAAFEFFMRRPPSRRNFYVAAGLEQVLDFLEDLRFSEDELTWLQETGRFSADFIAYLADLRFTGEVHAMPEGVAFFANEPILRVAAPLPVAQFVETRVINILHFQCLIAAKAARHVLIAQGKRLVDFGARRSHGAEAGLMAARASYIAGYDGSATVLAGQRFGVPLFGTMAHAFIEAFDDESAAFLAFARSHPDNAVLLIDTYDTEAGARKVVEIAPRLAAEGVTLRGVRIDSGDLVALSKSVRRILDDGGLEGLDILLSGGLDDEELRAIIGAGAPVDGFGVGTSLTTSSDAPALDCAYKLQEYAGVARRKRSEGKETWPGRKQVWRRFGADGRMVEDVLGLDGADHEGEPLMRLAMKDGRRLGERPTLDEIRRRAAESLSLLPEAARRLEPESGPRVVVAEELRKLTAEVDRRLEEQAKDAS